MYFNNNLIILKFKSAADIFFLGGGRCGGRGGRRGRRGRSKVLLASITLPKEGSSEQQEKRPAMKGQPETPHKSFSLLSLEERSWWTSYSAGNLCCQFQSPIKKDVPGFQNGSEVRMWPSGQNTTLDPNRIPPPRPFLGVSLVGSVFSSSDKKDNLRFRVVQACARLISYSRIK